MATWAMCTCKARAPASFTFKDKPTLWVWISLACQMLRAPSPQVNYLCAVEVKASEFGFEIRLHLARLDTA